MAPQVDVVHESDREISHERSHQLKQMQMINRLQRTQQGSMRYNPGKKPKSHQLAEETIIPQCKLKRIRFEATAKRNSQIGGGKLFRESQVHHQLNFFANSNHKREQTS